MGMEFGGMNRRERVVGFSERDLWVYLFIYILVLIIGIFFLIIFVVLLEGLRCCLLLVRVLMIFLIIVFLIIYENYRKLCGFCFLGWIFVAAGGGVDGEVCLVVCL